MAVMGVLQVLYNGRFGVSSLSEIQLLCIGTVAVYHRSLCLSQSEIDWNLTFTLVKLVISQVFSTVGFRLPFLSPARKRR